MKAEVLSGGKAHQVGEKKLCHSNTRVHQRVGDAMICCMGKGFTCDSEGRNELH
jgi:hypothetical protein